MICTACGSSNLVEGKLVDGHSYPVFFMIAQGSRWRRSIGKEHRKLSLLRARTAGTFSTRLSLLTKIASNSRGSMVRSRVWSTIRIARLKSRYIDQGKR
jgi:hypothetical protein